MSKLLGIAVAQIGLGVEEFYDLTFDELAAISEAYFDKAKMDYRTQWEIARFTAYYSIVPHTGKKKIRLQDVCRFDWERKPVILPKRETLDKMFPKTLK